MVSTIEETLEHALFYARHLNKCDPRCVTVAVLIELGFATKRDGFEYLKHAIELFREDPTRPLTKDIYPSVGQLCTPPAGENQVESAIREAIKQAWRHRDERVWRIYFQAEENGHVSKPSNAEFISRIGRFLELWQGCCEGANYGVE